MSAIPAIVNYIVSELERGGDAEAIGKALIENGGWKARDIEDSFRSIGITPPPLPMKAKLWNRLIATLGYAGLISIMAGTIAFLVWYTVVSLRTPEYIVERALTHLFTTPSVAGTAVIHAEMTAPETAFDSLFGAREGSGAREILNGTLRVTGTTDVRNSEHPKIQGTIRLDAKSSRFSTNTALEGEVGYIYDTPLTYVAVPKELVPAFPFGRGEKMDTDQVVSFDVTRSPLPTRTLTAEELAYAIELWKEHAPLTIVDKGIVSQNGESVRRYGYSVNPLSVKFILRDFSKRFPETFTPEQLARAEKVLESVEIQSADLFVSRRGFEIRSVEIETVFVRGNPFQFGGRVEALLTFEGYGTIVPIEPPKESVLIRFEDLIR